MSLRRRRLSQAEYHHTEGTLQRPLYRGRRQQHTANRVLSRWNLVTGRLSAIAVAALLGVTQWAPGQHAKANAPFTLHVGTRIVLTDVTVTDRNGHAVAGLNESAFRIFDNGHEQVLSSFEEHRRQVRTSPEVLARGEATNSYLQPPPAVSNVLLVDIDSLGAIDQMYLGEELTHFVQNLPAGESIAVYVRDGLTPRLLQDFTSDRKKLLAAVQMAVPHFRQADAEYATDTAALLGMVAQLQGLPGRKNLLWFSGGWFAIGLVPDASALPPSVDMRPIYDALETSRISVYPIDGRGLTLTGGRGIVAQQHLGMEEVAEATGGHAYYNNNGLAEVAEAALETGQTFYTLSYALHEPKLDGKWHKVKVAVGTDLYTLSYRRGYYNDGNAPSLPRNPERLRLLSNGDAVEPPSVPIVFAADASPSDAWLGDRAQSLDKTPPTPLPKGNEKTYIVRFHLPVSALSLRPVDGRDCAIVGTGLLVLNELGNPVAKLTRDVTLTPDPQQLKEHPSGYITFEQLINLPKGHQYLSVMVMDPSTGRAGTLHIALDVWASKGQNAGLHPRANTE